MHKIIISKTAKKVISNSQLKTENSAVKMIPAFEQNIRPLETAKQVRKLRVAAYAEYQPVKKVSRDHLLLRSLISKVLLLTIQTGNLLRFM